MKGPALCVFCLCFLLSSNGEGKTPLPARPDAPAGVTGSTGEELTVEQCIAIALERNPLLQSSRHLHQAALARVHQARAFSQPSIDFDSDLQPGFLDFKGSEESYVGVSQEFEFPGKRILKGKIAAREAGEFETDTELLKLDIIYQVKQVFNGLLLAQEILKYAEQDLELSRDYLLKAEIKFEAGDIAQVEILRARVETAKAENSVRAAANEVRLARARLNFLLARGKYETLKIRGQWKKKGPAFTLDELKERALALRPEIKKISLAL
ncbi:MAG: TolC family protein, partial [Candidatus Aminicenantes bacterium]|nr:TolC family protein [Candidatus Aminicenantes bacterium]